MGFDASLFSSAQPMCPGVPICGHRKTKRVAVGQASLDVQVANGATNGAWPGPLKTQRGAAEIRDMGGNLWRRVAEGVVDADRGNSSGLQFDLGQSVFRAIGHEKHRDYFDGRSLNNIRDANGRSKPAISPPECTI